MSEGFYQLLIGIGAGIFTAWGALWYRMGKLSQEVKQHNKLLTELKCLIESTTTKGGTKNE